MQNTEAETADTFVQIEIGIVVNDERVCFCYLYYGLLRNNKLFPIRNFTACAIARDVDSKYYVHVKSFQTTMYIISKYDLPNVKIVQLWW